MNNMNKPPSYMNPYSCQSCAKYSDSPYSKEPEQHECDEHEPSILCTQSQVSRCEADLFCEATKRLKWELEKARNIYELKQVFELISCLFTSSAAKENSLAKIVVATKDIKEKKCQECNDCNDCSDCKD